jgi:hypothetical protein
MRWVLASLFPLVVSLIASACGGSTVAGSPIKSCHASSDCTNGESCEFSVYASCGAEGVCLASPDGSACVEQTACSCSGATETICLVNGNAPSPVSSLGSCDGAAPSGFDASVPDATVTSPVPDAGDSGSPVDSSPVEEPDAVSAVDATDSAPSSTYGSPCNPNNGNADCTDPVYNQCGLSDTCTKTCTHSSQCPDPPTAGTCDTTFDLCN